MEISNLVKLTWKVGEILEISEMLSDIMRNLGEGGFLKLFQCLKFSVMILAIWSSKMVLIVYI